MAALAEGAAAPLFTLPDVHGREFSLQEHLHAGPVVLAFFKVSCPTCQFAFAYIDRLFRRLSRKANIVAISQDPAEAANLFTSAFDVSLPVLLDPAVDYPVSNAYGITHVPTVFLVSQAARILLSSVGWARNDLEELNQKLAHILRVPPVSLFDPDEDVPEFRSGCGSMN